MQLYDSRIRRASIIKKKKKILPLTWRHLVTSKVVRAALAHHIPHFYGGVGSPVASSASVERQNLTGPVWMSGKYAKNLCGIVILVVLSDKELLFLDKNVSLEFGIFEGIFIFSLPTYILMTKRKAWQLYRFPHLKWCCCCNCYRVPTFVK